MDCYVISIASLVGINRSISDDVKNVESGVCGEEKS
jgi:hypothetical protein